MSLLYSVELLSLLFCLLFLFNANIYFKEKVFTVNILFFIFINHMIFNFAFV